MVQLSHPYITGKTIATIYTFVGKVRSLLIHMFYRSVIAFLPWSKASFNFMARVMFCSDLGAQENSLSLLSLFPLLFAMK